MKNLSKRKNAFLIFSKPPLPGLVKTRLTPLKDGLFTPEIAAHLYHCMLFDVVEICCAALADLEMAGEPHEAYDIYLSTTPPQNISVMQKFFDDSGVWPRKINIIADAGASFDEHYNDAFDQVFSEGYDTILSFGGDMPTLPKTVIKEGFERLQELCDHPGGGIVLSPDQEMGVSLVGWTKETNMNHTGVFYNPDGLTVLPAYIEKAERLGLKALLLPAVVDVDTMADLFHNITLLQAIEYCASFQDLLVPWRTIDALRFLGYSEVRVPPNELRDSREGLDT